MTTIISIANEKGGVAKTTTTISLGAALAETGRKVLLVDLDAQSNLSLALNTDNNSGKPTMANVLLEGVPPRNALRETQVPGLQSNTLPVKPAATSPRIPAFKFNCHVVTLLSRNLADARGVRRFGHVTLSGALPPSGWCSTCKLYLVFQRAPKSRRFFACALY